MKLRLLLTLAALFIGTNAYRAAVIEYNVQPGENANKTIEKNIEGFRNIIEKHKDSFDIIVFPEYGLTGKVQDVENYAQHIPDTTVAPVNYKNYIEILSNIAREHNIYMAINVFEKENSNNVIYYFNTEVVFNRTGSIIAKYRKVNLNTAEKPKLSAGETKIVKFEALNNNFTLAINEDFLLLNYSSPELINTDIIVSSSLSNSIPFQIATSLQAGIAARTGKIFLFSNLNNPSEGISGTGIYKCTNNGLLSSTHITGKNAEAPVILETTTFFTKSGRGLPGEDPLSGLNIGVVKPKSLRLENIDSELSLDHNNYHCTLTIKGEFSRDSYNRFYRFGIFESTVLIGSRSYKSHACSLVTYNNDQFGSRLQSNITIEDIEISFVKPNSVIIALPISTDYDLKPFSNISYSSENNVDVVSLSGKYLKNPIAFGVQFLTETSASVSNRLAFITIVFSVLTAISLY